MYYFIKGLLVTIIVLTRKNMRQSIYVHYHAKVFHLRVGFQNIIVEY